MSELTIPEARELNLKALSRVEQAKAIVIKTDDDFLMAGEFLKGLKSLEKEIKATFDPVVKAAHEAHKAAKAARDRHYVPLKEAESIVKPKIGEYKDEQDRKAAEARRKAEDEARKKAEEEQLKEAEAAEKSGKKEEAEAIINEPVKVAPVVVKAPPKIKGVSMRKAYSADVFSLLALVKDVIEGKAPLACLKADQVFLDNQARALKRDPLYAGVRLKVRDVVSAGSR